MTNKFWLLLAFLTCPISAETMDNATIQDLTLKEKISQAISKFEQTKRKHWGYQVSRYENEEGDITSSIEQFTPDPALEKQWTLIRINEAVPTKKQASKFTASKLKQAKNSKKGNNFSIALREIINQDSLELIFENNNHIKVSFKVHLSKLGKDSEGKLQGSLLYSKQFSYIESITIVNNAEFSPVFSANISEFKLTFSFTNINDSILPLQQDMAMKGTFAYFTEINETSTDSFSNYSYNGAN